MPSSDYALDLTHVACPAQRFNLGRILDGWGFWPRQACRYIELRHDLLCFDE
jgi:hypothetical protein